MTNAQIVLMESVELMKKGVIGTTGRTITAVTMSGDEIQLQEPEEIHTYAAWKALGYQVQKGQKAVARFPIWKYTIREAKTGDEENKESMFMKVSAFFARSQVDVIV